MRMILTLLRNVSPTIFVKTENWRNKDLWETIVTDTFDGLKIIKAKFRRRTSHEPNRMQMSKILCSPSFAFDSAHVKYGV